MICHVYIRLFSTMQANDFLTVHKSLYPYIGNMTGIKGNIFPTLLSAISQLVICNCQESVVCVILIDMQQPKSEPKISLLIRC